MCIRDRALLDLLGVPYVGSDLLGCAIAMNKDVTKKLLRSANIATPDWILANTVEEVMEVLDLPIIYKPVDGGSSVGITMVTNKGSMEESLQNSFQHNSLFMCEAFVPGRELTVGIVGRDTLPVGEIISKHEIFDYECKYRPEMADEIFPAEIDEEQVKFSLLEAKATPELISKSLAELKANKVSQKKNGNLVLGADSVINLNGEIISKPLNRDEALLILKKLNGQKHQLISSVCISKNGSMIWNYTDIAILTMKQMSEDELKLYLMKINDKELYAYNVYQIEGEGRSLFSKIEGDESTIMGLPINQIKEYLNNFK